MRCSGKKPSPRARGYGKVDNHPKRYSLILRSTQALRELVRNQSPLHQQNIYAIIINRGLWLLKPFIFPLQL